MSHTAYLYPALRNMSQGQCRMRGPKLSCRDMEFPRDEGDHSDADFEWWYFNGHVWSDDGSRYGLMVCFLRHLLYVMVLDTKRCECLAIVVKGKTKRSPAKLDVSHANGWWGQAESKEYAYQMRVRHDEVALSFEMESLKPPLIIGKVPLGLLGFAHYYAMTRVAINGELLLQGSTHRVSGIGWIDRMWGKCEWTALDHWEWFSIILDDNSEIMVLRVFHPLTHRVHRQILVMTTTQGVTRTERFQVRTVYPWASPSSGIVYRLGWKIVATRPRVHLEVLPVCPNQELRRGIWEGECSLKGAINGRGTSGYAYVELLHPYTAKAGLIRRVMYLFISSARYAVRMLMTQEQAEVVFGKIKAVIPDVLMPDKTEY